MQGLSPLDHDIPHRSIAVRLSRLATPPQKLPAVATSIPGAFRDSPTTLRITDLSAVAAHATIMSRQRNRPPRLHHCT